MKTQLLSFLRRDAVTAPLAVAVAVVAVVAVTAVAARMDRCAFASVSYPFPFESTLQISGISVGMPL